MNIFNKNANEAHVVMFMIMLYVSCLQNVFYMFTFKGKKFIFIMIKFYLYIFVVYNKLLSKMSFHLIFFFFFNGIVQGLFKVLKYIFRRNH